MRLWSELPVIVAVVFMAVIMFILIITGKFNFPDYHIECYLDRNKVHDFVTNTKTLTAGALGNDWSIKNKYGDEITISKDTCTITKLHNRGANND